VADVEAAGIVEVDAPTVEEEDRVDGLGEDEEEGVPAAIVEGTEDVVGVRAAVVDEVVDALVAEEVDVIAPLQFKPVTDP